MAATPSTMLPLGTPVPAFTLKNVVDGRPVTPSDYTGKKGLLVMFICNHCPYVIHVRDEIAHVARDYMPKGIGVIAVNANDMLSHPEDGPSEMKKLAIEREWQFPFVFDETQDVARAFQAACTPEFYLFDGRQRLAYRGQLDDSRPGNNKPVNGKDLRAALEAVLAGQAPAPEQKPSVGCNIKWKQQR